MRPGLEAGLVKVAVLRCRIRSGGPETYRHFKAEIAVCNVIARLNLRDLPEWVRRELRVKGVATYTSVPDFLKRVPGLEGLEKGVEYVRLVLEG